MVCVRVLILPVLLALAACDSEATPPAFPPPDTATSADPSPPASSTTGPASDEGETTSAPPQPSSTGTTSTGADTDASTDGGSSTTGSDNPFDGPSDQCVECLQTHCPDQLGDCAEQDGCTACFEGTATLDPPQVLCSLVHLEWSLLVYCSEDHGCQPSCNLQTVAHCPVCTTFEECNPDTGIISACETECGIAYECSCSTPVEQMQCPNGCDPITATCLP